MVNIWQTVCSLCICLYVRDHIAGMQKALRLHIYIAEWEYGLVWAFRWPLFNLL